MRKKLLALLMCATMVLGTGVTAFADEPSSDTYEAARKILNNTNAGTKFTGEYTDLKAVTYTTYDKATGTSTTWAIGSDFETPYKQDASGKYLRRAAELPTRDYKTATTGITIGSTVYAADHVYVNEDNINVAVKNSDGTLTFLRNSSASSSATTTSTPYTVDDLVETNLTAGTAVVQATDPTASKVTNPSATIIASGSVSGSGASGNSDGHLTYEGFFSVEVTDSASNTTANYLAYRVTADNAIVYYFVNSDGAVVAKGADSNVTSASTASNAVTLSAPAAAAVSGTTVTAWTTIDNTYRTHSVTTTPASTVYYTANDLQYTTDGLYTVYDNTGAVVGTNYVVLSTLSAPTTYAVDADGFVTGLTYASTPSLAQVSNKVKVNNPNDNGTYYVVFGTANTADYLGTYLDTVAYALREGTLSKDAVALSVHLYKLYTTDNVIASNTDYNYKALKNVNSVSTSATLTLDPDFFSRTSLNANENYGIYVPDYSDSYKEDGNTLYRLYTVADAVDATSKFTFNMTDFTNGLIIFDGVEVESNNDGVSDTTTAGTSADTAATTASATAATSPKTGDVAPIAALAVVMMGACGAMVVASKKRA
jgi:hypothetical protein